MEAVLSRALRLVRRAIDEARACIQGLTRPHLPAQVSSGPLRTFSAT